MIYTYTLPNISLTDTWQCNFLVNAGRLQWYISDPPDGVSSTVTFPVELPADCIVRRAWLSMGINSPNSGAAYKRVNDIIIPSDGIVPLEGISSVTTSFAATFEFKANGKVYEDPYPHSGNLVISSPTINVEYGDDAEENPVPTPEESGQSTSRAGAGRQFPRLLSQTMREIGRIDCETDLTLNLTGLSEATMTIPWGQPEVRVRDFVETFSPHGSVGVFRVTETETAPGVSQTVYLQHGLITLGDDLALNVQAMSAPVRTVFATLLGGQTVEYWTMGDCDVPDDIELIYEHSYDTILAELTRLMGMLPDEYVMVTDQTVFPWVLHVRKLTDEPHCECRLNRNANKVRISVDTTGLCTRVYPFGAGEGTDRISLTTLTGQQFMDSDKVNIWGKVSKTFTEEDIYDSLTLQDVAQRYLDRHDEPTVSIRTDAVDLSAMTGEDVDALTLGRICLFPMPVYGTTVRERIISIQYPEVYGNGELARLTLANRVRTVSDEIAELMREATNSKLLGGTVSSETDEASYGSVTPAKPFAQYIDIKDYGNVLSVKVQYSAKVNNTGASVNCTIRVDDTDVPADAIKGQTVDILRYLTADENGVPTVGEHTISYFPITLTSNVCTVSATATIKTIGKR
jgi:phage minor structural protein